MGNTSTIVWFRRDLRLADNPALKAAVQRGGVVPVFIWAPDEEAPWAPGAAARWWLHHSLVALDQALQKKGSRLIVRCGPTLQALRTLMAETGADEVVWNRLYEPAVIARDKVIKSSLKARSFNANLLFEPWTIKTQADKPYQVFTPFYRACQVYGDPERPLPAPKIIPGVGKNNAPDFQSLPARPSNPLAQIHKASDEERQLDVAGGELLSKLDWAAGLRETWHPGEGGAHKLLRRFAVADYAQERDRPDHEGTSRLSPHLHFGEISPRQVWHAIRASGEKNVEPYLRQLIWREFAHHLLFHFPHTPGEPLRPDFKRFPWIKDRTALKAWQRGRTGFPLVDAGMRELWKTGWMHNRARMVVASFLVKDLLLPWQEGARWFWDTLVDADLANNTLGWQWAAGCGADAAPYFRIFNPHLQAAKFDPDGAYVRRWAPDSKDITPIVDHAEARERALAAYDRIR